MVTYRFVRRIVGNPPSSTVFKLKGYEQELRDVEVTITTDSHPEDGATCVAKIVKSNRESLFVPGAEVSLVRRMNDFDISMD